MSMTSYEPDREAGDENAYEGRNRISDLCEICLNDVVVEGEDFCRSCLEEVLADLDALEERVA